jgi:hypothetical protein
MSDDERVVHDLPAYWMLRLEMARERDDAPAIAIAERELQRLGVRVIYEQKEARDVVS